MIELIYTSLATPKSVTEADAEVTDILATSERNNVAHGVTGLLLFDGERYIQVLEGDTTAVDGLFANISADPRHRRIELLRRHDIPARSFADWRMAYEPMPRGLLDDLAESMGVMALTEEDESDQSFGSRLQVMFHQAIAAE